MYANCISKVSLLVGHRYLHVQQMKLQCSQPDGKGSQNLSSFAACNIWTMPHKTQVVGIAMQNPFNRNTDYSPRISPFFTHLRIKEASQLQKRSPLLIHRCAHEVPTTRLDARLIRTKLCRVTPNHAHFNVRSSAQLVQSSPKEALERGLGCSWLSTDELLMRQL